MASKEIRLTDNVNEGHCLTESSLSYDEINFETKITETVRPQKLHHSFQSDISVDFLERKLCIEQPLNGLVDVKSELVSNVLKEHGSNILNESEVLCNILSHGGVSPISQLSSLNAIGDAGLAKETVSLIIEPDTLIEDSSIASTFCDANSDVNNVSLSYKNNVSCSNESLGVKENYAEISLLNFDHKSENISTEISKNASPINIPNEDIEFHIDNIVEQIVLQATNESQYQDQICTNSDEKEVCNLVQDNNSPKNIEHTLRETGKFIDNINLEFPDQAIRVFGSGEEPVSLNLQDEVDVGLKEIKDVDSNINFISIEEEIIPAKQAYPKKSIENLEISNQTSSADIHIINSSKESKVLFYISDDEEEEKDIESILESTKNSCLLVPLDSPFHEGINTALIPDKEYCDSKTLDIHLKDTKMLPVKLSYDQSMEDISLSTKSYDGDIGLVENDCCIQESCEYQFLDKINSDQNNLEPLSDKENCHQIILARTKCEKENMQVNIDVSSKLASCDSDDYILENNFDSKTETVSSDINIGDNKDIDCFDLGKNLTEEVLEDKKFADILISGSPMLRRSRCNDRDSKRLDCRFIFEETTTAQISCDDESIDVEHTSEAVHAKEVDQNMGADPHSVYTDIKDNSNIDENTDTDQPLDGRQQYRSLRDSLDIVKQEKLVSNATLKNLHVVDDFDQDIIKEMLPNLRKPLSYKKKTSLTGDLSYCKGRHVSFPEEEEKLITSFLEPANPWHYMNNVTNDAIAEAYQASCLRYNTRILPQVLQQIAALPINAGSRIERLTLKNSKLDACQVECLEEIFRRVQFKILDFEECGLDDDTSIPLLDMIEFYDSTTHLSIACNTKIGSRGWQACARMLKRTPSLRVLDARNTNLNENNMPLLCRALRLGTRLSVLHLENCNLTGRPLVNLAGALRLNDTILELYLADNRLGVNDCIQLGNVVRSNKILKLLDLRNNNMQDTGCAHICKDILEQQNLLKHTMSHVEEKEIKFGIVTLNLWNNHLTLNSIPNLSSMLSANFTLETLNLGRNYITSEGILLLKSSLMRNRSLIRLGLQATRIGNEGVVALAECIADNNVISRIDLRENSIQVAGLMALSRSLQMSSSVIQIDLDFNPKAEPTSDLSNQHSYLQQEIKTLCSKNLTNAHAMGCINTEEVEIKDTHETCISPESRKISLTCEVNTTHVLEEEDNIKLGWAPTESKRYRSPEPSPCPSPSLSPSPSPVPSPLKNRFKVYKVSEDVSNLLSTSAPASMSMCHSMSGSLPSLVTAGAAPNRFLTGRRFIVTKVTDVSVPFNSSLSANRAMSSPSLIAPMEDGREGPTIVVSSPNKAVRGFSVDDFDTEISSMKGAFSPIYVKERSNSIDIFSKTIGLESPSSDDVFEVSTIENKPVGQPHSNPVAGRKNVVYGPPSVVESCPVKAPLASIEAGSFDSDSEDSEITTQSSDSTHSDEVRISTTEQISPKLAWEIESKFLETVTSNTAETKPNVPD